jgi:PadR family transcriptional regulator PadR
MTRRDPRMSGPTLKALRHLLMDGAAGIAGADITRATKVAAGTLYPLLARLEAAGWISGRWEDVDPREVGRPRRRFYALTDVGLRRARAELDELRIG